MYVYRVQGCQILQCFSITVMTFNKSGTLIDERFHKARVGTLCFTKGGIYKEAFMSLVCLCMCVAGCVFWEQCASVWNGLLCETLFLCLDRSWHSECVSGLLGAGDGLVSAMSLTSPFSPVSHLNASFIAGLHTIHVEKSLQLLSFLAFQK